MTVATQAAVATSVTATLTADNHYGLYYGDENGANLTLVGRNEFGDFGGPGDNDHNWTFPETWNFNMSDGQ